MRIATACVLFVVLLLAAPTATYSGNVGNPSAAVSCPSSGNKVISSTSLRVTTFTLYAPTANTGFITWGGSTVSTTNAPPLYHTDSYTAPTTGNAAPYDLSQIYFACSASGDTLVYNYLQ
jgi:hypothetical protein